MKNVISALSVIVIMLSSCTSVRFESSQPQNTPVLTSFPKSMIGIYTDSENDTLIISESSFQFGSEKSTLFQFKGSLLSEEVVFKVLNDYYVLSFKYEPNWWGVVIFKYTNKEIYAYYTAIEEDRESLAKKLKEIVDYQEIKDKNGKVEYFLINPTKKELETLIESGVFSTEISFKMIQ